MLRAVIIDDEQKGINSLKLLLEKFVPDVKVVATTKEAPDGIFLIEDYHPDIVFLDINMPHLNGFELLEKLSFRSFSLIFTTAHEEYALKAIKNRALDYLLKPIDIDDLNKALYKAREAYKNKLQLPNLTSTLKGLVNDFSGKLAVPSNDSITYIELKNIIRIEADSNYSKICIADNRSLLTPKTLKEYEKMLCTSENHFMRVHQSHIINLKHASKFLKEGVGFVVMKDDSKIPLSKNKRDDFLKWLEM